jgi:hypothetical protein
VQSGSRRKGRRFWHKYINVTVPHNITIPRTVNKLIHTGSLLGKQPELKCQLFIEEKLVLRFNIFLGNPSDVLHKRMRFENHQHKPPQNSCN